MDFLLDSSRRTDPSRSPHALHHARSHCPRSLFHPRHSDRLKKPDDNFPSQTSCGPASRTPDVDPSVPRPPLAHRASSNEQRRAAKKGTEEERLGLVKGDSHIALLQNQPSSSPERLPQPMPYSHPEPHSQSSSSASVDEYYHYQSSSPPQRPLSYSDEVDGWQMPSSTNPPNLTTSAGVPPATTSSRQRPSPPRIYQPPPLLTRNSPSRDHDERAMPGTMVGGGSTQARATPAAFDPFQSSSTSPPRYTSPEPNSGFRRTGGDDHLPRVSEDARVNDAYEYGLPRRESPEAEETRRRFEEQSKREREERRLRATGRRQNWKSTNPEGGGGGSFV